MPRDFFYYISRILSVMFHPLLMPLYGVTALTLSVYQSGDANRYLMAPILGTTIQNTCLWTFTVPVGALLIMRMTGYLSSLRMHIQGERTLPYFICSVCYIVWCVRLGMARVPLEWLLIAKGGTLALFIVAVVNRRWKISAHSTGAGGMTGSVLAYAVATGFFSWTIVLLSAAIAISVMCARIRLQEHTSAQVTAGWLVGMLCTLMPVFIYSITSLPNA